MNIKINRLFSTFALVLLATVSLIGLSACSNSKTGAIITYKGGSITSTDLYQGVQTYPDFKGSDVLRNLTFERILEKAYGNKVSDEDVTKQYNTTKSELGTKYESTLAQQGLSDQNLKAYLKLQLLEKYAVDQAAEKTQYTESNLAAAWKTYQTEHHLTSGNPDQYKSQLQKMILAQKEADTSYVASVMADELKKYDVTVRDTHFSNLFSQYQSK